MCIYLKNWIKQAPKGFRPISTSQNFERNFWEISGKFWVNFLVFFVVFFGLFSGTSLEIVWGFMVGFWFGIFWPIIVIQNFLVIFKGIFPEYFGNFWEFSGNFLGIVWKSFGNSLRILNCILTKSCESNMKWCNFWLNDRQGQQIKSLEALLPDHT